MCDHFVPLDQECEDCCELFKPKEPVARGAVMWGMKHAANCKAWALGVQQRNGFRVRRIVWGLALAREEVREGEEIRKAAICVDGPRGRR